MKSLLKTICMTVYQITMPAFMIIGCIMVLTQIFSALTSNGNLCVYIRNLLRPWAFNASCLCLFASFINSYLKEEK